MLRGGFHNYRGLMQACCPVGEIAAIPIFDLRATEARMDRRTLDRIATVMDACLGERRSGRGRGHPPADTVRVLATLRQ
jgi:hypothetical protein